MDNKTQQDEMLKSLLNLKEMTRMTGELYELQERQLKYWPMIISTAVKGCETHFKFDLKEIVFLMEMDLTDKREFEAAKHKFPLLTSWCHDVFGEEYAIKIKVNGKTMYKGPRKEKREVKATDKQVERDFLGYVAKEYNKSKKTK